MQKLNLSPIIFGLILIFNQNVFSQACTTCTTDPTCTISPPYPTSCPTILPSDTAGNFYETTVTFYMPQQFDITSPINATVTFVEVNVLGVSGLPAGMSWSSFDYTGANTTTFHPSSNPPGSERLCAKICGTPIIAGSYNVQLTASFTVNVPGFGDNSQIEVLDYPLTIYPSASGNAGFSMSASSGCGSVNTTFTPNLQSGGDPLFEYDWDFGNGITSTDEFPPAQTYSTPGSYVVNHQTTMYAYQISEVNVSYIDKPSFCGDVEEPNWPLLGCTGEADAYFILNDNNSVPYTSSIKDNNPQPSWTGLNFPVIGNQVTIQLYDDDWGSPAGSPDDDLGSKIINIAGAGTYTFTTLTSFSPSGAVSGNLKVIKVAMDSIVASDTIVVYENPTVGNLTLSADTLCVGDSIIITAPSNFSTYQWYEDGLVIPGENTSTYTTSQIGSYTVEVTNQYGCVGTGAAVNTFFVDNPPSPQILPQNNFLVCFLSGYTFQWYKNDVAIPAPIGTNDTLFYTESAAYQLVVTSPYGCSNSSVKYNATYKPPIAESIGEINLIQNARIIPNPNNGNFTLELESFTTSKIDVKVVGIGGNLIGHEVLSGLGTIRNAFELSHVESGIYFIRLTSPEGEVKNLRFIKN